MSTGEHSRYGAIFALGAYLWWGFMAVYIKQLAAVDPREIVVHRIVWTGVTMLFVVGFTGRMGLLAGVLKRPRTFALLTLSGLLIVTNWLIFVWAVNNGRVNDTSLGYFINPLLLVLVGLVILREHLRPWQTVALAIATAGVLVLVVRVGVFPWIALSLSTSFALYGFMRKLLAVDPFVGLLCEMIAVFPLALGYFAWLAAHGQNTFGPSAPGLSGVLLLAGPVTAVPLVLFSAGARRITMTSLGFFQYITPTISFCLAVFVYGEHLTEAKLTTFVCIWIALAIYTADATLRNRQPQRQAFDEV